MEEEADKDYYATLGVSSEASQEEIKAVYKQLARQFHPDKNPDPAATGRFQDISEAYSVLSNPEKRAIYDEHGTEGLQEHFDMDEFIHTVDIEDLFDLHGDAVQDFFTSILFATGMLGGFRGGKKGSRLLNNLMKEMNQDSSESGESVDEEEMQAFDAYIRSHFSGSGKAWTCALCSHSTKSEKAMHGHFEEDHYEDFLQARPASD